MAALAKFVSKLFSPAPRKDVGSSRQHRLAAVQDCRLRPMPNEEVHIFIKEIDNSRVVPMHNPSNEAANFKRIGVGAVAVVAAIALVFPAYWNKSLGSQLAQIENEQKQLHAQLDSLEVREAELLSPKSLHQFAKSLELNEPNKLQTFVLGEADTDGAYALNQNSQFKNNK